MERQACLRRFPDGPTCTPSFSSPSLGHEGLIKVSGKGGRLNTVALPNLEETSRQLGLSPWAREPREAESPVWKIQAVLTKVAEINLVEEWGRSQRWVKRNSVQPPVEDLDEYTWTLVPVVGIMPHNIYGFSVTGKGFTYDKVRLRAALTAHIALCCNSRRAGNIPSALIGPSSLF